jgi:hypothetical protein
VSIYLYLIGWVYVFYVGHVDRIWTNPNPSIGQGLYIYTPGLLMG